MYKGKNTAIDRQELKKNVLRAFVFVVKVMHSQITQENTRVAPLILTSTVQMEASSQLHALAALSPQERVPITLREGGRVSKTAGLHALEKRKLKFRYIDFLGAFFALQQSLVLLFIYGRNSSRSLQICSTFSQRNFHNFKLPSKKTQKFLKQQKNLIYNR